MSSSTDKSIIDRVDFYRSISKVDKHFAPLFWLYNSTVIRIADINLFDLGIFSSNSHFLIIEEGSIELYKDENLVKKFSENQMLITKDLKLEGTQLRVNGMATIHIIDFSRYTAALYDNDFLVQYFADYYQLESILQ